MKTEKIAVPKSRSFQLTFLNRNRHRTKTILIPNIESRKLSRKKIPRKSKIIKSM